MLYPTSNPWQPVQPAVIIRSRLSITRRVTGCWTDEGLLQGALPGSPSSLAPQELAAVSDIQGRSPLTDFSPREHLWALRHRATYTLADWLRRWQGHRVHSWDGDRQGFSELSPSPPASITGVPAPALAVCLRHSSSKNILATPAGGSCLQSSARHQGYNGRNLVLPRHRMLARSLVETCRAPLGSSGRPAPPSPGPTPLSLLRRLESRAISAPQQA